MIDNKLMFFDCEIGESGKILDIGATSFEQDFHSANTTKFSKFAKNFEFAVGHNIVDFDILYLPQNVVESMPQWYIDTLYLSVLLFAKRPYHRLLKDDKFKQEDNNNPLNDSIKAKELFFDECLEWDKLPSDLKTIYFNLLRDCKYFVGWFKYLNFGSSDDNFTLKDGVENTKSSNNTLKQNLGNPIIQTKKSKNELNVQTSLFDFDYSDFADVSIDNVDTNVDFLINSNGICTKSIKPNIDTASSLSKTHASGTSKSQQSPTSTSAFNGLYSDVSTDASGFKKLSTSQLKVLIAHQLKDKVCGSVDISNYIAEYPIELAYTVALIEALVDSDFSIFPHWLTHKFPKVCSILNHLRGANCKSCEYCRVRMDTLIQLKKWFGYDGFRLYDGLDLQKQVAQHALDKQSLLAVFPTGGGKSITFQLPALMQWQNQMGLTVVISPLQSLQKDQVDNLEVKHQILQAARLDGSLDPIDRAKTIERVEDGSCGILYVSPESLRSRSLFRLLLKRNVVRFVIDEAHCLSSWGQDFRIDYLYISEFILNYQKAKDDGQHIPVSCFTATAKTEVVSDIESYFKLGLGLQLKTFVSFASRDNLDFVAIPVQSVIDKDKHTRELLTRHNCPTIVYVSRTHRATDLAKRLNDMGFRCVAYHGKMDRLNRIENQESFLKGECDIVVATKAFGMGVDKDNVGLVVHYDISSSLEDYLQEAGRAGRDPKLSAKCVAFYNDDDINKHFSFLSQTKLTQFEINQIWKAIKGLTKVHAQITASTLEIAREAGWNDEKESEIGTRVSVSIHALESVGYLKRGQNSPKVYATSLMCQNTAEVSKIVHNATNFDSDVQKQEAIRVASRLFKTKSKGKKDIDDDNARVDFIADREQLTTEKTIKAMQKLKECGVLANDNDLFSYLKSDNGATSKQRLNLYANIEKFLIKVFERYQYRHNKDFEINLKEINTELSKEFEKDNVNNIKNINKMLNYLNIKKILKRTKQPNPDVFNVQLYLSHEQMLTNLHKRYEVAKFCLQLLYSRLPQKIEEQEDLKVEFSVLSLRDNFNHHHQMMAKQVDSTEIEDALYYLKSIGCLDVDGGFFVVYSRMTINKLANNRLQYNRENYKNLERFYEGKKEQIHVVAEYLKKLMVDKLKALNFSHDYFVLNGDMFRRKYFVGRLNELKRNMTQSRYDDIFRSLSPVQRQIVDDTASRFISVVAGPGSGKTMLLVHKLASVYMQEDVKHEQILMLTFSRAAANEFKTRLIRLIGNAALFVRIKTFHSYCFDLLGKIGSLDKTDSIIQAAIDKIDQDQVDNFKLTNAIMVIDEAQDISAKEYQLIQRLMSHNEGLRLIAVGDDDQNIYQFRGSSSQYLAKISQSEGGAKYELLQNYRSKCNLVEFANNFADKHLKDRLKTKPLEAMQKDKGNLKVTKHVKTDLTEILIQDFLNDSGSGRSCIMVYTNEQALAILGTLWQRGIKAKLIESNDNFDLIDLYELRCFFDTVSLGYRTVIDPEVWDDTYAQLKRDLQQSEILAEILVILDTFKSLNPKVMYKSEFRIFLTESKWHDFLQFGDTVVVSTIHKTKGREFDNVYLGCDYNTHTNRQDEFVRTLYVAITRAKQNLSIHYTGDVFDDTSADGCKLQLDYKQYDQPPILSCNLVHRDVVLSAFESVQTQIATLKSGQNLRVGDTGLYLGNVPILKFSNKFKSEISNKLQKGYKLYQATVQFVVWWYNKEKEQEFLIVLPKLDFRKREVNLLNLIN